MRFAAISLLLILTSAPASFAQTERPIPPIVVDVRGFFAGLGQDEITAFDLNIPATSLPKRAIGGVAGVHVHPLRRRGFAVGAGAEVLLGRGRSELTDALGEPIGISIERRLQSIAFIVSMNFGHRDGWSYLSAGMGPMRFETFVGDSAPAIAPPRRMTLNFGGGARWFTTRHIALALDLRFYETKPEPTTATLPGRERRRLLVLSAGLGFK